MVINPSSVTGKNLGTVLKKICEHYAGVEIRQTGMSRQSGSSTHTVQFSILTENNLLLESYYFRKSTTHHGVSRGHQRV